MDERSTSPVTTGLVSTHRGKPDWKVLTLGYETEEQALAAHEAVSAHPLPQGRPGRADVEAAWEHWRPKNFRASTFEAFAAGAALALPPAVSAEDVARVIDQKTIDWARNAIDRHAKFFPASPYTLEGVVRNSSYEKPLSEALAKAHTILALFSPAPITADAGKGE